MRYSQSDAYIINRGGRSRDRRRGAHRAAGILITVLLLLTAAICVLVVFLPRGGSAVGASALSGKTYYFLCTSETEEKVSAVTAAQYAAERGGAGYIYNDGKYRVVAAVYERESDVKTLVTVNADSFYFSLGLAGGEYSDGDKAVLKYLTGEWFTTVYTAATELDRGNITESAAEHAVKSVCDRLCALADDARSERLKTAVFAACAYEPSLSRSVLSTIRYIQAKTVLDVISAVS